LGIFELTGTGTLKSISIDAGSQQYSIVEDKRYVSQGFQLEVSVMEAGAGWHFHRSMEGEPIYGETSVQSMLKNTPWSDDSYVSLSVSSMKDFGRTSACPR
jgi:hypothetical protein